ncbi:MAG: TonB-dependent receptor [Capnocytophaga sp.]|nr:TonB-dependent receptor [Capnocytophaga sp.]
MKLFCFFILFWVSFSSFSQNQKVSGIVIDSDRNPIQGVTVVDKKTNKWAITDEKGNFSIPFYKEYELEFSFLGMERRTIKGASTTLRVALKDENLRLNEVVVTATKAKDETSSAIVLDKYAISQFQTFSLTDVLQQLPGQTIKPPSLNSPNIINNIRTARASNDNSFGFSFIVDDMQLSNDENMQTYNAYGSNTTGYSSVNTGIDLRSIPTTNIERIEVVTGIADAKYGNATTGLVLIERKAGQYPLQINGQMRGGGQSLSLNKGFLLSEKIGKLSISLDYLNSNENPTQSMAGFDRITTSAIWTYEKQSKFRNSLSINYRSNIDDDKKDLELNSDVQSSRKRIDYSWSFNNRANWQLDSRWIDRINLQTGGSYSYQDDTRFYFVNMGGRPVPTATETSLYEGLYTPAAYMSQERTIGEPININAQFSVEKNIQHNKLRQLISAGISFNYSHNIGEGKVYDTSSASTQSSLSGNSSGEQGVRGLNFKRYVIPSRLLAFYFQDNLSYKFDSGRTASLNLGFRVENQNGFYSFSPRINSAYEISKKVKIRGGLGMATKAPSLANRFPGDKYFDFLIRDIRTNYYSMNLIQTYVFPIEKVDLKPAKSWKYELGTDIDTRFAKISLTAFYNHSFDSFSSEEKFVSFLFPEVQFGATNTTTPPTYSVTGYRNIVQHYSLPNNNQETRDKGVEIIANFKKIRAINTNFSLVGSYYHTNSKNASYTYQKNTNDLEQEYIHGLYHNEGSMAERLSFRLTATHHISQLGLLISLTAEQFTYSFSKSEPKNIYPFAYVSPKGEIIPIANPQDTTYSDLWRTLGANSSGARIPMYHNFHLRLTKEMTNGLSLSLYVTNFLDYRPRITVNNLTQYYNSTINFGASAKYAF